MKPFVLDEPVNGTYWPELEQPKEFGDCGTGYYNVVFQTHNGTSTGYNFLYMYNPQMYESHGWREHKYNYLSSISLPHLRKRVIEAGFPWKVIDVETAINTLTMNLLDLSERNKERVSL